MLIVRLRESRTISEKFKILSVLAKEGGECDNEGDKNSCEEGRKTFTDLVFDDANYKEGSKVDTC